VLSAAPDFMQRALTSTGVAATIFEYVRRWNLYEDQGFRTMREYAEVRLGVKGQNYREYARGGKAMWDDLPELASQVIQYVSGQVVAAGAIAPPSGLPCVPPVSVLRVLPRALRGTDPSERSALIARVEAGKCTYEELREKGKVVATAEPAGPATDDASDAAGGAEDIVTNRPAIFENVPDLEETLASTRVAMTRMGELASTWDDDGGPDVDPILPRVRALAGQLRSVATELEDNIIPRTVCSSCSGEGCRACRGMGWFPRVPLHTGPKKAAPRRRARTVRRAASGQKNVKQKVGR
jgi:hypothetical protein